MTLNPNTQHSTHLGQSDVRNPYLYYKMPLLKFHLKIFQYKAKLSVFGQRHHHTAAHKPKSPFSSFIYISNPRRFIFIYVKENPN